MPVEGVESSRMWVPWLVWCCSRCQQSWILFQERSAEAVVNSEYASTSPDCSLSTAIKTFSDETTPSAKRRHPYSWHEGKDDVKSWAETYARFEQAQKNILTVLGLLLEILRVLTMISFDALKSCLNHDDQATLEGFRSFWE